MRQGRPDPLLVTPSPTGLGRASDRPAAGVRKHGKIQNRMCWVASSCGVLICLHVSRVGSAQPLTSSAISTPPCISVLRGLPARFSRLRHAQRAAPSALDAHGFAGFAGGCWRKLAHVGVCRQNRFARLARLSSVM